MPVLDDPKYEAFAQAMAQGKTADQAYVIAGYNKHRGNASRLRTNERIASRIDEIISNAAALAEISIASVTENLVRIAGKAEKLADSSGLSVAKGAWMDAAKVNGLIVERSDNLNRHVEIVTITDEEIAARLRAIAARTIAAKANGQKQLN